MIINILDYWSSFPGPCVSYVYILTGARVKKSIQGVIMELYSEHHFLGNLRPLNIFQLWNQ